MLYFKVNMYKLIQFHNSISLVTEPPGYLQDCCIITSHRLWSKNNKPTLPLMSWDMNCVMKQCKYNMSNSIHLYKTCTWLSVLPSQGQAVIYAVTTSCTMNAHYILYSKQTHSAAHTSQQWNHTGNVAHTHDTAFMWKMAGESHHKNTRESTPQAAVYSTLQCN